MEKLINLYGECLVSPLGSGKLVFVLNYASLNTSGHVSLTKDQTRVSSKLTTSLVFYSSKRRQLMRGMKLKTFYLWIYFLNQKERDKEQMKGTCRDLRDKNGVSITENELMENK